MYAGVPSSWPVPVRCDGPLPSGESSRAIPKSRIFDGELPPPRRDLRNRFLRLEIAVNDSRAECARGEPLLGPPGVRGPSRPRPGRGAPRASRAASERFPVEELHRDEWSGGLGRREPINPRMFTTCGLWIRAAVRASSGEAGAKRSSRPPERSRAMNCDRDGSMFRRGGAARPPHAPHPAAPEQTQELEAIAD